MRVSEVDILNYRGRTQPVILARADGRIGFEIAAPHSHAWLPDLYG